MLDEDEFASVSAMHFKGEGDLRSRLYGAVLQEFQRITGFEEANPSAVSHHRLVLYGPPCERCGKPLRTPQAKLCGSCMHPVRKNVP